MTEARLLAEIAFRTLVLESEARADRFDRAALSWRARCILNLRDGGGSWSDIAEILGTTPGSVETEYKRAKRRAMRS
jgi:hypothetical protein